MTGAPDTALPDPLDVRLASCVAEMLATPQLACRRRRCRRGNYCHFHFSKNGLPACVANLKKREQDVFQALYLDALYVRKNWGGLSLIPAEAEDRELRDAAFEVVRRTLPRREWRAFARRLRMRAERGFPAGSPEAHDMEAFEQFLISKKETEAGWGRGAGTSPTPYSSPHTHS